MESQKPMDPLSEMLAYNKRFVEGKMYEQYATSKFPDRKIAIVTCMDTRLVQLLPAALGIKNGDVKIIKNAGGTITNPFCWTNYKGFDPEWAGASLKQDGPSTISYQIGASLKF